MVTFKLRAKATKRERELYCLQTKVKSFGAGKISNIKSFSVQHAL